MSGGWDVDERNPIGDEKGWSTVGEGEGGWALEMELLWTRDVALGSRGASGAAVADMDEEEGVADASLGSQRSGRQMFQTLRLLFVISGRRLPEVAGGHQKRGQPLL